MTIRLQNIDVEWISLVKKGANKRPVICKAATSDPAPPELKTVEIRKLDEEKQMVFGVVYAPDDVDTQGEYAKAEDIEKAAHSFMRDLRNDRIDKQHNELPQEAFVAETWIVRKADELFPEDEGAWAVGIKVEDPDLWQLAKDGEIGGLSMGGTADKVVEKAISFSDAESLDGLYGKLMRLEDAIYSIIADEDLEDKTAKVGESIDQFKASILDGISKADSTGLVGRVLKFFKREPKAPEDDMDKKDTEKLIDEKLTKFGEDLRKELSPEENKETLGKIMKGAFDEAVKPLNDRIEKIEGATPGTKQGDEDPSMQKSDEELEALGADIAKYANGE